MSNEEGYKQCAIGGCSQNNASALCRGYNAHVIECAPTMDAREATCAAEQQHSGATFVPPYNAIPIIAGQGTIALEFLRQVSTLVVLGCETDMICIWPCLAWPVLPSPAHLKSSRERSSNKSGSLASPHGSLLRIAKVPSNSRHL